MKYILPSTLIIGILIGACVNTTQPEYLSVNFEDNHYIVEKSEPVIPEVHAAEPEIKKIRYQVSDRTLDCVSNYPGTAKKIAEKFGEYSDYAMELYCRESSFNHKAINPTSGACGLTQSLPCAKMGCDLDDIDCQLAWGYNYINKRYGNAQKAIEFHDQNNWY
jgi:hypothetical protein